MGPKKIYINEIGDESAVIYVKTNSLEGEENKFPALTQVSVKDTIENVSYSMKDGMSVVSKVMKCAYNSLKKEIIVPDELEIEMGIELSSNVGVILVSGEMNANITIKAIWKKEERH